MLITTLLALWQIVQVKSYYCCWRPQSNKSKKINIWIWGKAKNGSYIKYLYDWVSLKAVWKCIKWQSFWSFSNDFFFLTSTALQLVSCWTEFVMQFMQMKSFSSVDIKMIHHWYHRIFHHLHIASDITDITFK